MNQNELLVKDSYWMTEEDLPIVLSSRVRLARNLADNPFPHTMSGEEGSIIEQKIVDCLVDSSIEEEKLFYLALGQLKTVEKKVLIEKHLISPVFAELDAARGVALSESHKVSIMVNEEDHLRIQVLMPGSKLADAMRVAGIIDDLLEERLDIAYKEKYGYLTSCPTNVGTGLRASVMVHLPALVMTQKIQQVLGALAPLGLAVRGLYGEGSRAFGNIFQISNQITLGKREEDTLAHLEAVARQLVESESQARVMLRQQMPLATEDKVWRSRGILGNARLLSGEETFMLLSDDCLGIDMEILPKVNAGFVSLLINSLQGSLQYRLNKTLDVNQINLERANFLRQIYK